MSVVVCCLSVSLGRLVIDQWNQLGQMRDISEMIAFSFWVSFDTEVFTIALQPSKILLKIAPK